MKKKVNDLILEITRRCSCACEHCLRGDAMDLDMNETMIPHIFENVESVDALVFSGGEPSLNIPIIRKVLDYCKEKKILVDNVWLATNGLQNQKELIDVMNDWLDYCLVCTGYADTEPVPKWLNISDYLEEYRFGLACSMDEFHPNIDDKIYRSFKNLIYYDHSKEGIFYKKGSYKKIILTGSAYENGLLGIEPTDKINDSLRVYGDELELAYVSVTGYVYNGCNYSYQDMDDFQNQNSIYEHDLFHIAECNEEELLTAV